MKHRAILIESVNNLMAITVMWQFDGKIHMAML